jgi:hypothetical protein
MCWIGQAQRAFDLMCERLVKRALPRRQVARTGGAERYLGDKQLMVSAANTLVVSNSSWHVFCFVLQRKSMSSIRTATSQLTGSWLWLQQNEWYSLLQFILHQLLFPPSSRHTV